MRALFGPSIPSILATHTAPLLIGAGLTTLLLQFVCTVTPVATAYSLIALGATTATTRIGRIASSSVGVAVHLFVYASLYLLFIGAICDSATRGTQGGLTLLQVIDLGLSAGLMAFVARTCVAAIVSGGDAPAR